MHIISRKKLHDFWSRHPDAKVPLQQWYWLTDKNIFPSFASLAPVFGSQKVDKVGKYVVFDIGGNKYRLITAIHFNRRKVYIREVLTHAQYDKNRWQR